MRIASPDREWDTSLSKEHEAKDELVETLLSKFAAKERPDPVAVVGPYGSGKTQFLYHFFKLAWKSGIPSLYIPHAIQILKNFEDSEKDDIVQWLDDEVTRQLDAISSKQYDQIEWFPNFADRREKIDEFSHIISNLEKPYRYLLLIDELEQAYKEFLRKYPTSDYSPLRIILDSLQNAFMVWSFGLLSAYEFIGGADIRRFHEIRLPPVMVNMVRSMLPDGQKELANFIWWFSQGRLGWIIKLKDEAPKEKQKWVNWVDESLSEYLEGNARLINPVWRIELPANRWNQGIQALLFLPRSYENWTIEDSPSIKFKDAVNTFVEVAKARISLGGTEIKVLHTRLNCLLEGLSSDGVFLPLRIFWDKDDSHAINEMLLDHIIAFEPRSKSRDNLIEGLREVDKSGLQADIASKLSSIKENTIGRTIQPKLLRRVFPTPIVNPDLLSAKTTEEILNQLEFPISIELPAQNDVNVKINICFKKSHFESLINSLQSDRFSELCQLSTIHVFVIPPEQSWGIEVERLQRFINAGKIVVQTFESRRLFEFIVKLWDYAQKKDKSKYEFNSKILCELIESELQRELRRTLEELWDQLQYWLNGIIEKVSADYKSKLAVENAFLWRTPPLADERLYWTSGRISDAIAGFSYCFVVEGNEIKDTEPYLLLPRYFIAAYDSGLIKRDEKRFPFKEFLDNIFTSKGALARGARRQADQLDLEKAPEKYLQLKALIESLIDIYMASNLCLRP